VPGKSLCFNQFGSDLLAAGSAPFSNHISQDSLLLLAGNKGQKAGGKTSVGRSTGKTAALKQHLF